MRLDDQEFDTVKASLAASDGPELMELMRRVTTQWPIDEIRPEIIQKAQDLGWIDRGAFPTNLGHRIGDPIRELLFWNERDRTVHHWNELPVMVPETFKDKRVLSVGCGCGTNLFSLQKVAESVVGIDVIPLYLQFVPLWAEISGVPVPKTVEGPAERMPLGSNEFDVLICLGSLQYMTIQDALSEMARVLKPGGIAIITLSDLRGYVKDTVAQWRNFRRLRDVVREGVRFTNMLIYPYVGRAFVSQGTHVYPRRSQMRSWMKQVDLSLDESKSCRFGEGDHEVCYVAVKV